MADWYCSSAAYATYTAFQGSHAYIIGDIIVPTAPASKAKWVFRCTTAGSSTTEPSWNVSNNGTSTSGTATFTNITGQSSFFWTAAAGDLASLLTIAAQRVQGGDRVFLSSDHTETVASSPSYAGGLAGTASYSVALYLSVNRAGSTPPVAGDLTAGATITVSSGTMGLDVTFPTYHYGITYAYTGSTTTNSISVGTAGNKSIYLDNCQLYLNTATAGCRINANGATGTMILNNTTLKFGSTSQGVTISNAYWELVWQNTASAIAGATIPSVLFLPSSVEPYLITCRGVDLSAITGTLVQNAATSNCGSKWLFDSCQIASGVTRFSATNISTVSNTRDLVELVNCYDGTNILSESYQVSGTLTTETTITLNGGAADDVGSFSHKIVTNTNVDKFVSPFASFWMDVENTTTGVSKTATVEIISSTALNNDEIALYLQYEGTAGSSVASFGSSFILTPLTAAAAVTTSTATWNSSPSTPAKQKCQVTFTPRHAGRLRGQIRVGKASCTVYINPQIAIT